MNGLEPTVQPQAEVAHRKQQPQGLSERLTQITALYQTADAALRATEIEELLEAALTGLESALKAERASVQTD